MARLAQCCPSSDDELPDINTLLRKSSEGHKKATARSETRASGDAAPSLVTKPNIRRVRRLGVDNSQNPDNPLLQRWNSGDAVSKNALTRGKIVQILERKTSKATKSQDDIDESSPPAKARATRARRPRVPPELKDDSESESESVSESGSDGDRTLQTRIRELQTQRLTKTSTIKANANTKDVKSTTSFAVKEIRMQTKEVHKSEVETESHSNAESEVDADEPSAYQTAAEEESDGSASFYSDASRPHSPGRMPPRKAFTMPPAGQLQLKPVKANSRIGEKNEGKQRSASYKTTDADLADTLSTLRLDLHEFSEEDMPQEKRPAIVTPPSTPPRSSKPRGLPSPKKLPPIPTTPHRPSTDAFWSQELVNDWNDLHSPRKPVFAPRTPSPVKESPKKASKKLFEARKHALAEKFLQELDTEITRGKIAELAESTGGVKLVWTKTLNTTAGRANWKRETLRSVPKDETQMVVRHKHHASIELAEKVIDDENRLLNVVAHEFCHLATFMVDGVTNNPHGRHFKAWAARCSAVFGNRGIVVTTKHSYEIDFKYVWQCIACSAQFKRHSKSIDPQRHRCGSCKSTLKQIKPTPRVTGQPSEYQVFVKEHMAKVRQQNPGSPQKEVMKLVAERWANREKPIKG